MSDTQTTLAGIVGEAVGPLPRVCAEQVLRDLERARMTAEDYREGNAVCNVYGETFRQRVASQTERIANDRAYMRTLNRRWEVLDAQYEDQERTLRAVTIESDRASMFLRGVTIFARLTDAESALRGIRMVLHTAGEDTTAEDEEGNMDVVVEMEGDDVE